MIIIHMYINYEFTSNMYTEKMYQLEHYIIIDWDSVLINESKYYCTLRLQLEILLLINVY